MEFFEWLRDRLFLWRRPCALCGHRRPEFLDGRCFDCKIAEDEASIWNGFKDWLDSHLIKRLP